MAEESPQERLVRIVTGLADELHPRAAARVTLDARLDQDLGLDSLSRVELLLRIGREFGVALPDQALYAAETLRDLLVFIQRAGPTPLPSRQELRALTGGASVFPSEAQTLVEALDWHVHAHPGKLHVQLYGEGDDTEDITYRALKEGALSVAAGLAAHRLEPGDRVAIMLPTGKDYLFSFFGTLVAGGVPVPIYPPARLSQIEDHLRRHAGILANSQARLLITIAEAKPVSLLLHAQAESLEEVVTPAEVVAAATTAQQIARTASDLALLQYTSGSTGNPKGVCLTHANLLANVRAMGTALQVGGEDVVVSWLPLYHDMGLIGAWLGSLYYGLPLALMSPLAFLARPSRWLWAIHRHRATLSGAPNFAYDLCARRLPDSELEGLDLSSWRVAFNGAEPVSADTVEQFANRFAAYGLRREAIMPVYGLAECAVGLSFPPLKRGALIDVIKRDPLMRAGSAMPAETGEPRALRVVSCGRPLAGHEVRIVDETGREVGDRVEGRLEFKGPSTTSGYFHNPEQTRRLFHGDWLDSGDFGYVAHGEIYITGRVKDVIIRGGRNIHPYDLEQAVGNIPGIRRGCVAVFGVPDPVSGTERLVVLAETRSTDPQVRARLMHDISAAALDVLGMTADEVVLAPPHTVLKTSSGKIRRAASREYYERGGTHRRPAPIWLQIVRLAVSALLPELRRSLRAVAAVLYAVYAWTVLVVLALPVWLVVAAARRPRLARWVCHGAAKLLIWLTGIRVSVTGMENLPRTAHVLAANHASYVDFILLGVALPPENRYVFVAKREFVGRFIPRLFLEGVGVTFVERFDAKQGVEDVERVEQAARGGASPVFFPEGTFDRQPGLREFRLGAFLVAARTGLPVVPVGIRGARSILRGVSWFPRLGAAGVAIGAPIPPPGGEFSDAIELRDRVRTQVMSLSAEADRLA